ncbi:MAG: hypothetical protein M3P43_00685 [Actinomycetota bacterium]|nr:hypothetical protein [Actinomycetota bacterium]
MHRSIRVLAPACALAAVTLIVGAPAASAHAQRQAGPIHMEIGFGTEPAYVGQPNSVQIILTENGKPVVELGDALKVQVSFGGQQTDLPLEANFEVGGDGMPGDYRAWFIPSQPGPYTFHFTGTLHNTKIDESLTSGPRTFDEVQDPAEAAFPPVNTPTAQELADRIQQDATRLSDAMAAAASAKSAADSARTVAIVGVVVGLIGLVAGATAVLSARKARRQS